MKRVKGIKFIIFCMLAALFVSAGIFFWHKNSSASETNFDIKDFNFDRDSANVDELFHKGDNWYWMLHNGILNTYSLDFTLRNKSSSQSEKLNNLVMKVLRVDGKLAGFLAYYPHSKHVWQLLFLLVDQDFRRQGIAKKLLKFALGDMAHRGAIKVDLATRNNNFRSQGLYKGFGMKQTGSDEQFVFFSWYK